MAEFEARLDSAAMRQFFSQLNKNVKDMSEKNLTYWRSLQAVAFKDVMDHFEKERGPEGKWKSWSRVYAERMRKRGKGGNRILQDTGRVRANVRLAQTHGRIGQGQLLYNPARAKDGRPYAYEHDTGVKPLPQREFMWLSDRAMRDIDNITANFFVYGVD